MENKGLTWQLIEETGAFSQSLFTFDKITPNRRIVEGCPNKSRILPFICNCQNCQRTNIRVVSLLENCKTKIHIMKLYLFIFISLFFIHCSNPPSESNDQAQGQASTATFSDQTVPDSQKIAEIEDIILGVGQQFSLPTTKKTKIPVNLFSEKDELTLIVMENGMSFIRFTGTNGDTELGPLYYLKNGKILFCRNRIWKQTGSPYAQETMMYFDENENLIHAKERRKELEEGKAPLTLGNLPFEPSNRSKKDLMEEFNDLWLQIKKEAM